MVHITTAYLNATQGIDMMVANHDIKRAVRESQVTDGVACVYTPTPCTGLVVLENDPSIKEKFKQLLMDLIPEQGAAKPSRQSRSGKDEAHLRAALLSSSVTLPIKKGALLMSPWQEVIVYDFDDKVCRRELIIHIMGEEPQKQK